MEVDHGWCHSLYYLDPNGIMVEFCRDTPGFEPDPDRAHEMLTATPR
jgi:catechol-2,3-dioxygenase